jgi:hypothetical protein
LSHIAADQSISGQLQRVLHDCQVLRFRGLHNDSLEPNTVPARHNEHKSCNLFQKNASRLGILVLVVAVLWDLGRAGKAMHSDTIHSLAGFLQPALYVVTRAAQSLMVMTQALLRMRHPHAAHTAKTSYAIATRPWFTSVAAGSHQWLLAHRPWSPQSCNAAVAATLVDRILGKAAYGKHKGPCPNNCRC